LPKKLQTAVHKGKMSMKDALLVLKEDQTKQHEIEKAVDETIKDEEAKGSSAPETRRKVKEKLGGGKGKPKKQNRVPLDKIDTPKVPNGDGAEKTQGQEMEGIAYEETETAPEPRSETSIRLQMLAKILEVLIVLENHKDNKVSNLASALIDYSENEECSKEEFLASV